MNIDRDLLKHSKEFAAALRNHQYEVTDEGGILFPKQRAICIGMYEHDVNGEDVRYDRNVLTLEGLTHMLTTEFSGGSAVATWYLSLFATNYAPVEGLTLATYNAAAGEILSATEGYGTTRPAFNETTPVALSASVNNTANKAAFTFVTASSKTVWGAALMSVSTTYSGTLMSAAQFTAARTLYDTDVFNLGYSLTLSN